MSSRHLAYRRGDIVAPAGVNRQSRQRGARAAAPHVDTKHANAAVEQFAGHANHVAGAVAAAQSMHEHGHAVACFPALRPTIEHGDAVAIVEIDDQLLGRDIARAAIEEVRAEHRLSVPAAEQPMRLELR